jgi:uncharacterized protein
MKDSKIGTALITGASAGIGAIYARKLAQRGYDLILVARNRKRLNEMADELGSEFGTKVSVWDADLTDPDQVQMVERHIKSEEGLTLLVNNAGFGGYAPLLESDVNKMDEMIQLNVTALTRLTYAAVPGFVQRGRGAIINIASIVAIAPEILNGVYGATKAYVQALSYSLHHELHNKGIQIQAVLPGATATDFWNVAGLPVEHLPSEIVMNAEDMVNAALVGFDQGELITIPSLHDFEEWKRYEASRQALSQKLGNDKPAPRYLPTDSLHCSSTQKQYGDAA